MDLRRYVRLRSVLTNGMNKIEIQVSRYSCGITPPPGMTFSVLNGRYYINGKEAWVAIEADGLEDDDSEA